MILHHSAHTTSMMSPRRPQPLTSVCPPHTSFLPPSLLTHPSSPPLSSATSTDGKRMCHTDIRHILEMRSPASERDGRNKNEWEEEGKERGGNKIEQRWSEIKKSISVLRVKEGERSRSTHGRRLGRGRSNEMLCGWKMKNRWFYRMRTQLNR